MARGRVTNPPAPNPAWQAVDDYADVMGSPLCMHMLTAGGNVATSGRAKCLHLHGKRHFDAL
eukprot:4185666-Lingulodinium_polyedra.AAC.1